MNYAQIMHLFDDEDRSFIETRLLEFHEDRKRKTLDVCLNFYNAIKFKHYH